MRCRRAARLVLAVVVSVGLAACGLAENDDPQPIAGDPGILDPDPTTTTLATGNPASAVTVYFLERVDDATRLAPTEREVADPSRAGDRIAALFAPPTDAEQKQGLSTSIPVATVLLEAELHDEEGELVLDLSSELFDVEGEQLVAAFAQIVWTVTEIDGVQRVRFLVEGEEIRVPDAEGVENDGPVTKRDYAALRPVD